MKIYMVDVDDRFVYSLSHEVGLIETPTENERTLARENRAPHLQVFRHSLLGHPIHEPDKDISPLSNVKKDEEDPQRSEFRENANDIRRLRHKHL